MSCREGWRIVQLEQMDSMSLRRENNTARRTAELARIKAAGGSGPPGAVGTTQTKAKKRKCTKKPAAMKGRKRGWGGRGRDKQEQEESSMESDGDEDGEDEDMDGVVEADVRQTRSWGSQKARPAPTDVPEVDGDDSDEGERAEDNTPKWAKNARMTLLGVGSDVAGLEARWTKGVQLWWDLERSTRFVSPVKGLGTTKRPDEIHTWIKGARTIKPKIKSMSKFVEEWQEWWRLLNPEWRTMGDEVTGMIRADEESLEMLRKPGANGFLSVHQQNLGGLRTST
ncbi:hypothetical protein C8R45DRAFT_947961 [Mycena sanguinolenta]|nr:hypothetical protein C8R45DRAFT_947961 [Mycena sanguinolenta]